MARTAAGERELEATAGQLAVEMVEVPAVEFVAAAWAARVVKGEREVERREAAGGTRRTCSNIESCTCSPNLYRAFRTRVRTGWMEVVGAGREHSAGV